MADKKISQLSGTLEVQAYDNFPSARLGQNYKLSFEQMSYTGITAGNFAARVLANELILAHWYALNSAGANLTQQYYVQATEYGKFSPQAHAIFNGEWMEAMIYDVQQDPLYLINPLGNYLGSPYMELTGSSSPSTGTNFPIETRWNFRSNYVSDQQATQITNKVAAVIIADNTFKGSNSIDVKRLTMTQCKTFGLNLGHTSAPGPSENIQFINCDFSNVSIITDGTSCTMYNVRAQNCTLYLSNNVNVYNLTILSNADLGNVPDFQLDGNFNGFAQDGWAGTVITGMDGGTSTVRMTLDLADCYDTGGQYINLPPGFPVGIYQITNTSNLSGPFPVNQVIGGTAWHEIVFRWAPNANPTAEAIQWNFVNNPLSANPYEIVKYNQFPTSLTSLIYEGDHIHIQIENNSLLFWLLKGGNHYH